MMSWGYVYASVRGTSHIASELPCQDASDARQFHTSAGAPVLVLVAADGAGSASRAEVGSKLVCDTLLEVVSVWFTKGHTVADITCEVVKSWLEDRVRDAVASHARGLSLRPRDFACTLLAAITDAEQAVFLQIGDGAIVITDGEGYRPVFWPQSGEYANTTYFVTDETALDHLQFKAEQRPVDEIALFTDGLQMVALHYTTKSAHAPFFRPLFARLRCEPEGESELLNDLLKEFLDLPSINGRTDDDKTLLLATRPIPSIAILIPPKTDGSPNTSL